MNIEVTSANAAFFEALASETRLRIIELLSELPLNIKELASALSVSSAIVTKHVQQLENAGIVQSESVTGKRGMQKRCRLKLDTASLSFRQGAHSVPDTGGIEIPVGQYVACDVKPTCGLASVDRLIGAMDDPRYFADPGRAHAAHLWFSSGWVEYRIPNYMLAGQRLTRLNISFEICSEAPGYNDNWPSDIDFSISGCPVGTWTCPGDFGGRPGLLTPAWWTYGTQYGLLKTLTIDRHGSFVDGIAVSDVAIGQLDTVYGKDLLLRIESRADAKHPGGVSLFGRGFGNYNQNIVVHADYE